MRRNGIKRQAMMIAVIPILLMSVLLEGFGLYQRFGDQDRAFIEHSRSLAKHLAATSEYAVFSGNADLLKRNLEATVAQRDVKRIIFYDASGNSLLDSATKSASADLLPARFGLTNSFYEDQQACWIYEAIIPTEIKLDEPGEDAAANRRVQPLGGVLVEVSKRALNDSKDATLMAGLLITAAVCLVSLGIAFYVAGRITMPIMELNRAIRSIGEGRMDTRIRPFAVSELDQLGGGINTMATLLQQERDSLQVRIEQATDEIRVKKELAENANREKSRFLAAAGHDLRQPLAAANLFVDALKLTVPTARQDGIIQRLDQAMDTFNGMLDALLNISKLDAGVIHPEYTAIDVMELLTWLESGCEPLAREKRLGFSLRFPVRNALAVRGDVGLVKSVMMNLVTNAIKYTSEGGVLVSARRRGGGVLFQVWDTGVGIPDEHIRRIFDEFYQVDNPQRDRKMGLGLGLSIAKRALSVMGGEISCRSHPGRGTVFSFRLPLLESPAGNLQGGALAGPQGHGVDRAYAKGKRFILVEDDALVAQALVDLLGGIGGEVVHFHRAEDALHYPAIGGADCIITDYMLGGAHNGIQLLNLLRTKLDRPINAVLMTGDTSPAFMAELKGCAWTVLHKPINLADLIACLKAQA